MLSNMTPFPLLKLQPHRPTNHAGFVDTAGKMKKSRNKNTHKKWHVLMCVQAQWNFPTYESRVPHRRAPLDSLAVRAPSLLQVHSGNGERSFSILRSFRRDVSKFIEGVWVRARDARPFPCDMAHTHVTCTTSPSY